MRLKRTNKRLLNLMCIIVVAGALVVMNVLFTMFTHKHLWSQRGLCWPPWMEPTSTRRRRMAQRGTIYDRNGDGDRTGSDRLYDHRLSG